MPIPMTLGDHLALEAYEARLTRKRFARAYQLGRTVACAIGCSVLTLGCALAQIGGAL